VGLNYLIDGGFFGGIYRKDVVLPHLDNDVSDADLCEYIAIEAGQCVRAERIVKHSAARDPEIEYAGRMARDGIGAPVSAVTLAQVHEVFSKWLYLPDQGFITIVLAAVAANLGDGDPVWLLLLGPPGSGKTELLDSLLGLPRMHTAGVLTEAALLSGTSKREYARDANGGLPRAIGDSGVIVCKDFTTVLSMGRETRTPLLAALREVYDGAWTRHVGTDGGRSLTWKG
jgi:hypothetical protein